MNARRFALISIVLIIATLGAGCGAMNPTQAPTAMPPVRLTQPPTFAPTPVPSATATATVLAVTPTPSDPARKAVEDTFAALQAGDYEAAAALYSNFSLMVDEVTRGEAAAALKAQFARGETISGGQVLESRVFDERTHLVHVRYLRAGKPSATASAPAAPAKQGATATATLAATATAPAAATAAAATQAPTVTLASGSVDQTRQAEMIRDTTATAQAAANAVVTPTATAAAAAGAAAPAADATQTEVDEWWPVRMESGQWRYNRNNLIDFETLDVPAQTTAGLTVKPRQIKRYTDHLTLTLLVQNQTNETIVLGQKNEVLATFLFGDKQVEAQNKVLIFERLRSNPDTVIDLAGLYETYPDGVIIRKWKNLQVPPWFNFQFN